MKPPQWLTWREKVVFYLLSFVAVILRMDLEVEPDETWKRQVDEIVERAWHE
jgi:hypothetical protein